MDIHYNAFISYRHHPDDIRVAAEIHRSLEHYKVPKAIRKKSKGITRLFRDKEELPITSDLTTDITRALENSEYLIVICSTHTKESTWVLREIETFLKTHDRNKVLTVLVNGEPYDTIPEILLSEERVDPVTGEVTKIPIEPLSCDWRMKHSRAKREELPRLAAALLNCGYNELRQRERQYRTRRMIAAFSTALAISLCFMAYFIYSNLQIQEANERLQDANIQIRSNLDQALENQSMFLANASGELLDSGDRLTAIALALEALPEYEGERPYVAEAELALTNAVGAYQAETDVVAVGTFSCDALISDFKVTDDGDLIYIVDHRNVITAWNTETFLQTGSIALDFSPGQLHTTASGNALVLNTALDELLCIDSAGTILWRAGDCDDIAFLDEKGVLMVAYSDYGSFDTLTKAAIRFLDPDTGKEARDAIELEAPDEKLTHLYFLQDSYPGDMSVSLRWVDYSRYVVCALDLDSGSCPALYTMENRMISCAGISAQGNVLIMSYSDAMSMRGSVLNMVTTLPETIELVCLDSSTGRILWKNEITTYIYGTCATLETIPGSTDLLCQIDNAFLIIDSLTGEILSRCETASPPLWVNVGEASALMLLEDGRMGSYHYEENQCDVIKYMEDNLTLGEVNGGAYVKQYLQTQVVVYRSTRDDNWQRFAGDHSSLTVKQKALNGDLLAIETYTELYVFDTENQELLWRDGGDYSFHTEILGFSEDGATLWCICNDKELVAYDARTGASERTALPDSINGDILYFQCEHRMVGNKIYYITESLWTDEPFLFCWDIATGESRYWKILPEFEDGVYRNTVLLDASDSLALIWDDVAECVFEIDLASGDVHTVLTGIASRPAAETFGDAQYLLGAGNEIRLYSSGAEMAVRIPLSGVNAGAFNVHDGQLLALCDDGYVYRYDMAGVFQAKAELHIYSTFQYELTTDPSRLSWSFTEDGDLVIDVFGYGNIIDGNTWQNQANINHFVAYAPNQDALVVSSAQSGNSGIGSYRRYTVEQLMEKARDVLGDFELSEAQKISYGLLEE